MISIGLGSLSLMYMMKKEPPEWLQLASFLITGVGVIRELSETAKPLVEPSAMAGYNCGCKHK